MKLPDLLLLTNRQIFFWDNQIFILILKLELLLFSSIFEWPLFSWWNWFVLVLLQGPRIQLLWIKAIRFFIYVFNNLLIKHSVAYAYNHGDSERGLFWCRSKHQFSYNFWDEIVRRFLWGFKAFSILLHMIEQRIAHFKFN